MTCVVLVWAIAVASGMGVLLAYQKGPGTAAQGPARWPLAAPFQLSSTRRSLVMFAHPHCPCTRASIEELARLLTLQGDSLSSHVAFYRPQDFPLGWERTGLWDRAASLPGVQVRADEDGRLARLFGAATSGQVLLYGIDGRLLFSGGITAGRGHQGDNAGRSLITKVLEGAEIQQVTTPVYGCSLLKAPAVLPVREVDRQ